MIKIVKMTPIRNLCPLLITLDVNGMKEQKTLKICGIAM